ncbi:hypothetical protein BB453_03230 [Helicobacter pylori]|nr:hypothetical protein BB453_03230 [Helicobacter pylori]
MKSFSLLQPTTKIPQKKESLKKRKALKKRGFKKQTPQKRGLKREFHKGVLASSKRTHNSNTRYRACGI